MSPRQKQVLDFVARHPGWCTKRIARALGMPPTSVTWNIMRLRSIGFQIGNGFVLEYERPVNSVDYGKAIPIVSVRRDKFVS